MKTSPDDSAADGGDASPQAFFHEGMRAWQDRFDSRRLADRLEEKLGRNRFTADDRTQTTEASPYVPRPGVEPPVPAWKRFEMFSDVLPRPTAD